MANYKEQTATGQVWQRCSAVQIGNPLAGGKTCVFVETQVVSVNGESFESAKGFLPVTFNPATTFALLNPETGEPTGETRTHLDLYQLLYSAYIHHAMERDNEANP